MKPMKGEASMKTIAKLTVAVALLATAVVISGCANARQPNYQGHKGVSPTVHDYYPSNPK
jgi:hypothetical protein